MDAATGPAHRPPAPRRAWRMLLLLAAVGVAVAVFVGYGQSELLLEAVNLRYCG